MVNKNNDNNDVKMAYLLLVHNNPIQVNMFINQILNYGKADVYIHVDKKNKPMTRELIKDDRVFVISEYEVKWASFEMMAATILLMRLAINSGENYTHIYYGSGNDLLVKNGMYEFLSKHPKELFMKIMMKMKDTDPAAARYRIKWPKCLMRRGNYSPCRYVRWIYHVFFRLGIVIKKNNNKIDIEQIYRGSQWFVVPFEVIKYLIEYIDANPNYLQYWKHALAPDEFLFQTIIMNSKYKEKVKPSIMYIHFSEGLIEHNHPLTITNDCISQVEKTGCFCARKFDMLVDKEAIDYFIAKTYKGRSGKWKQK